MPEIILFVTPNCMKCMEIDELLLEALGMDGYRTVDIKETPSHILDGFALNYRQVPIVIWGYWDEGRKKQYRTLRVWPESIMNINGIREYAERGCGGCGRNQLTEGAITVEDVI